MNYDWTIALLGIAGGIATGLASAFIWELIQDRVPFIFTTSHDLSGYWVASFSPDTVPDSNTIELTKLRHRKGAIYLYQENYNTKRNRVWVLRGRGKIRASNLCAHYYYDDKAYPEVGTFILNLKATPDGSSMLEGCYSQLINRPGMDNSIHHQGYVTKQVKVPLRNQLRRLIGRSHFSSHEDIKKYLSL